MGYPALIEPAALAERLTQAQPPRILDATYHLPPSTRDEHEEFMRGHLPGAAFFDIDAIADRASHLPHMLPSPQAFERAVGELGVCESDEVVVYDAHGLFSAPRVWWTFRYFGHERISVLNGGLPQWLAENRPLIFGDRAPLPRAYHARPQADLLIDWRAVQANLDQPQFVLLDQRAADRFAGRAPEPRQGMRAGCVPNSVNLPWTQLVDPDTQRMRSEAELRDVFSRAGVLPQSALACSCGSGITACVAALALYLLGNERAAVYDGSWAEWGSRDDLPLAHGASDPGSDHAP
ncbi:MAG: 3-mercaptopyruvate sulfurtransferase [Vampirovibrionales bacterium]|nr:3-mercaptopyruvate sulfurtransferase [Vampirovibrionales bacterium]